MNINKLYNHLRTLTTITSLATILLGCSSVDTKEKPKSEYEMGGHESPQHHTPPGRGKDVKILRSLEAETIKNSAYIMIVDPSGKKSIYVPNRPERSRFCSDGKSDSDLPLCKVFSQRLFLKDVSTSKSIRMSGSPQRFAEELWPGFWVEYCYDDETLMPLDCSELEN